MSGVWLNLGHGRCRRSRCRWCRPLKMFGLRQRSYVRASARVHSLRSRAALVPLVAAMSHRSSFCVGMVDPRLLSSIIVLHKASACWSCPCASVLCRVTSALARVHKVLRYFRRVPDIVRQSHYRRNLQTVGQPNGVGCYDCNWCWIHPK